jgi:3-phenylpropionate/trans-cinnamate dioxygenase ferredoxin reductase subunit
VRRGLVIVGGSYAAMQAAASAREAGYQEPVTLLSDEADPPYHRPPLSKTYLQGKADRATLWLRAPAFYQEHRIELRLGTRVDAIDRAARRVTTARGETIEYDRLVLATGARPRALPGTHPDGVVMLRGLADSDALAARLKAASSLVVIGGGFIGLEVASAARALGKQVTVIEALDRLLARALAPPLSAFVAEAHRARGVRVVFARSLRSIEGTGRVQAVVDSEGERHEAELVLVGIGAVPNQELAAAAGLAVDNGIVVDRATRTSDPAILAAGDCARYPSAFAEAPVRLESVQNATDQAKVAGAVAAGQAREYDAVPWFWSDQYDLKLQMVGLSQGHDSHAIRGRPEDGKFAVLYMKAGRLIALDTVNRPAEHILGRKLVAARVKIDPSQAADPSVDLKSLLAPGS